MSLSLNPNHYIQHIRVDVLHTISRSNTKQLWHWRKQKSWPANKRDTGPRYRPSGKCPPCRFEATCQFLHPAVGSSQMECICTWPRSLSLETDTGATQDMKAPNRSGGGFYHLTSNWPYQGHQVPYFVLWTPTACHHCGQTLTIDHMLMECAVLQESRDEYYTVDTLIILFETIPESCIVEFLRESGFFYLIWTVRHSKEFFTRIIPEQMQYSKFNQLLTWTI